MFPFHRPTWLHRSTSRLTPRPRRYRRGKSHPSFEPAPLPPRALSGAVVPRSELLWKHFSFGASLLHVTWPINPAQSLYDPSRLRHCRAAAPAFEGLVAVLDHADVIRFHLIDFGIGIDVTQFASQQFQISRGSSQKLPTWAYFMHVSVVSQLARCVLFRL